MPELSRAPSANEPAVPALGAARQGAPFDDVDLLLLSVASPLTEAVCATVCGSWSDAADLWFLVSENTRYRAIATECGFEAAVNSGEFELAEYFSVHNRFLGERGAPTAAIWAEFLVLKAARKRFFTKNMESGGGLKPANLSMELTRLRLWKKAVQHIFVGGFYRRNPKAASRLLADCYAGLGFHAAVIGLQARHPETFGAPELWRLYERSLRLEALRSTSAPEVFTRFLNEHPAGPKLTAIVDSHTALWGHGVGLG